MIPRLLDRVTRGTLFLRKFEGDDIQGNDWWDLSRRQVPLINRIKLHQTTREGVYALEKLHGYFDRLLIIDLYRTLGPSFELLKRPRGPDSRTPSIRTLKGRRDLASLPLYSSATVRYHAAARSSSPCGPWTPIFSLPIIMHDSHTTLIHANMNARHMQSLIHTQC